VSYMNVQNHKLFLKCCTRANLSTRIIVLMICIYVTILKTLCNTNIYINQALVMTLSNISLIKTNYYTHLFTINSIQLTSYDHHLYAYIVSIANRFNSDHDPHAQKTHLLA
jgi:hypothetical protein